MSFKELETVVLDRDLPEHGLRRGDLGAVVQVYRPDELEVEFVTASGRTLALVTPSRWVRDAGSLGGRTTGGAYSDRLPPAIVSVRAPLLSRSKPETASAAGRGAPGASLAPVGSSAP